MTKKELSNAKEAYEILQPLARKAVECDKCFEGDSLNRPDCVERPKSGYVKFAQPRYIGGKYWDAKPRIAFVMINPGAGKQKDNEEWQETLEKFNGKDPEVSLEKLFEVQRKYLKVWARGKIIPFIKRHLPEQQGIDDIALLNIAWCATEGNAYPSWMLRQCFEKHTYEWLRYLKPDVVILSGRGTEPFELAFSSHFWKRTINVFTTYHYAHRPRDTENAKKKASEIKGKLKEISAI